MNRSRLNVLLALTVAVGFLLGLRQLFQIRFEAGDIYPPGSSRRADPVGTRALHDSLALLPGKSVDRWFERIERLPHPAESTVLLLGVPTEDLVSWSADVDWADLDALARAGGRVVIGLLHDSLERTNRVLVSRGRTPPALPLRPAVRFQPATAWGLTVEHHAGSTRHASRAMPVAGLPESLPWPAATTFTNLAAEWRVLYRRDDQAVVVERPLGSGSLVLLASDYLATNEGLRLHRQPGFLAWMVGDRKRVVFDETHHGLTLQPGVAGLIRQYRLGGAVAGLALLAALAVWRQMARFNPPPEPPRDDAEVVAGRPASAGLVNILRRSVDPADLIATCFEVWRGSAGRTLRLSADRRADLQDVVNLEAARPRRERDPLGAYRRLTEILRQR